MGEDKSGKVNENESRKVLGDVTNQLGKRGFSLISRSPTKPKIRDKQIANDDSDNTFWKQVALVVEKLENERGNVAKCPKIGNEVGLSPLKGGKIYRLQNSSSDAKKGVLNAGRETKGSGSSVLDSIVLDAGNVVGETAKGGCVSRVIMGERSKKEGGECVKESQGDETVVLSDVAEDEDSVEVLGTQVVSDGGGTKSIGVDWVGPSRSESIVSSRLGESQEMQGFGLQRCTLLKGDDGSSVAADMESIKQCSCSFCTKAAFIWSDLHYQDMKGRLSVLEKSKNEASNLAQKYYTENDMGRLVEGNNVNQLEIDLMSQWRSLFFHMEDMYGNEGSQLKNNLVALKEIRDDYKMNLKTIGMPVDVLQCSSESSDHTTS